MDHMKTATVRDLRYRFPEVEARLREGEEVQITKRKQVVARLVPVKPERARVFGDKVVEISGKELVSWARGQH